MSSTQRSCALGLAKLGGPCDLAASHGLANSRRAPSTTSEMSEVSSSRSRTPPLQESFLQFPLQQLLSDSEHEPRLGVQPVLYEDNRTKEIR